MVGKQIDCMAMYKQNRAVPQADYRLAPMLEDRQVAADCDGTVEDGFKIELMKAREELGPYTLDGYIKNVTHCFPSTIEDSFICTEVQLQRLTKWHATRKAAEQRLIKRGFRQVDVVYVLRFMGIFQPVHWSLHPVTVAL